MGTVNWPEAFGSAVAGTPVKISGKFDVLIEGGVGTVEIQRSLDDEVSWQTVSQDEIGTPAAYTTNNDVAFNGMLEEADSDIPYRFNCTAWTSGAVNARFRSR